MAHLPIQILKLVIRSVVIAVSLTSRFVASSPCGGSLSGGGYIRSPNFPNNYENNLRCNWTLVADPYKGSIVLEFESLATEACCDFLSIYNRTGLIGRFSGYGFPVNITLGSEANISFNTDNSVTNSGFSIWFSTSATTESPKYGCESRGNFYCNSSNLCVPRWQRCNGYSYCTYGEDEVGCSSSLPALTTTDTSSVRDSCLRRGNFYCDYSRQCIPYWYRCDGSSYCSFGEDESGCGFTSYRPPTYTSSVRDSCLRQGSFYCDYSRQCIPYWYRCDGSSYCSFGEDESGCGFTSYRPHFGTGSRSQLDLGCFILVSGYAASLIFGLCSFDRV